MKTKLEDKLSCAERQWSEYGKGKADAYRDVIEMLEGERSCKWEPLDWTFVIWQAECGLMWQFNQGTPSEHEMNYCPKCGKKLEVEEDDTWRED